MHCDLIRLYHDIGNPDATYPCSNLFADKHSIRSCDRHGHTHRDANSRCYTDRNIDGNASPI